MIVSERLASFVASVCDATLLLKNAWRPFWRLFERRLGFVVALRRKLQPRGVRRCLVSGKNMRLRLKIRKSSEEEFSTFLCLKKAILKRIL